MHRSYNYGRCGACLLPDTGDGAKAQLGEALAKAEQPLLGVVAKCVDEVVRGNWPWACVRLLMTKSWKGPTMVQATPALPLYVPSLTAALPHCCACRTRPWRCFDQSPVTPCPSLHARSTDPQCITVTAACAPLRAVLYELLGMPLAGVRETAYMGPTPTMFIAAPLGRPLPAQGRADPAHMFHAGAAVCVHAWSRRRVRLDPAGGGELVPSPWRVVLDDARALPTPVLAQLRAGALSPALAVAALAVRHLLALASHLDSHARRQLPSLHECDLLLATTALLSCRDAPRGMAVGRVQRPSLRAVTMAAMFQRVCHTLRLLAHTCGYLHVPPLQAGSGPGSLVGAGSDRGARSGGSLRWPVPSDLFDGRLHSCLSDLDAGTAMAGTLRLDRAPPPCGALLTTLVKHGSLAVKAFAAARLAALELFRPQALHADADVGRGSQVVNGVAIQGITRKPAAPVHGVAPVMSPPSDGPAPSARDTPPPLPAKQVGDTHVQDVRAPGGASVVPQDGASATMPPEPDATRAAVDKHGARRAQKENMAHTRSTLPIANHRQAIVNAIDANTVRSCPGAGTRAA